MSVKRIFFILFLFLSAHVARADKLEKAFERLKIYDYFLAKKYFEQSLKNKTAGAAYGLSVIYSRNDNPFYHLDSARVYILLSDSSFQKNTDKQKIYYSELGVTDSSIQNLKASICTKAFTAVARDTSIDVLNKYISDFSFCSEVSQATELRNAAAFKLARALNTSEAYNRFISEFPGSKETREAEHRYEERIFLEKTADKSLISYVTFLQEYPKNLYRPQAEKMIYTLSTSHKTIDEYYLFIKNFPANRFVNDAWREIYRLFMQNYNEESIEKFKERFPDYPFRHELEQDVQLQTSIFLPFSRNEMWGYLDETGKEMLKPEFTEANFFSEGLAVISKNDRYGYISKTGKEIIPVVYEEAEPFHHNYAVAKKNGKFGLINRSNQSVVPFLFDDLSEPSEGVCVAVQNDKSGYVSTSGKKITEFVFDIANDFKDGYAIVITDDLSGLLNQDGTFAIDQKYESLHFINDILLKAKLNGKWGIVNVSGETILPFEYDAIGEMHENRILLAKNKKLGFADASGKTVIPLSFPYSENMLTTAKFREGHAVLFQKTKTILIDTSGTKIPFPSFEDIGIFSEGFIPFRKNKKWGYADLNGKIKIQNKYESVSAFENGFAKVSAKTGVGLINKNAEFIVDPLFADIYFKSDYIIVKSRLEKEGVLSKDGHFLILPSEGYDRIEFLSPGIAAAYMGEKRTYYSLPSGKVIWREE
jgi:hypothetical protein